MTIDPPESPGDDPWQLPADLGEDFIRGGKHEPPARTRAAVAKYGGQRTSWRHGGIAAGPAAPLERPRRSGRQWRTSLVVIIVLVVALGAGALYVGGRGSGSSSSGGFVAPSSSAPSITAISSGTVSGSAASTGPSDDVRGIARTDAIGACYSAANVASATTLDLSKTDCAKLHDFELVAHEVATGDDTAFPPDSYWSGPVAQKCYQDLLAYTMTSRDTWPTTLDSYYFRPSGDGWKAGDRGVYCLGRSTPRTVGSVNGQH